MKVYIISEVNIMNFSSTIISVYSDKKKAKRRVDELNGSLSDDSIIDYTLKAFEVDTEDIEYD